MRFKDPPRNLEYRIRDSNASSDPYRRQEALILLLDLRDCRKLHDVDINCLLIVIVFPNRTVVITIDKLDTKH